jgi:hypothetical protein
MKKYYSIMFLFLMVVLSLLTSCYSQSDFKGKWLGELSIQGMKLRIVFNISEDSNNKLKATLDSPDQSAFDISVSEVSSEGNKINLSIKIIGGSFEGTLNENSELVGEFKQAGMTFPMTLKKTEGEVKEKAKHQEPKKPYPYNEEEVTFQNLEAGVTLAGTFTYPKEGNKFPTIVLVSGSGQQDRNESLLGHKPFLVLSDYLTKLGCAVLRYDDRGFGKSTGDFLTSTTIDNMKDALAAVTYLKLRKEIDVEKIGIMGHSEGGLIAAIAAATSDDVCFIVMLAGTGVVGEQILYAQGRAINKASGMNDENNNRSEMLQKDLFSILRKGKDDQVTTIAMREYLHKTIPELSESFRKETQMDSSSIETMIKRMVNPWFRTFLSLDPAPYLQKVKVPVLAINGEKDIQVLPKQNLPAIEKALKEGKNKDYTVKELKGLNHLFQKCNSCNVVEYSTLDETFSNDALSVIGDWIKERFAK